MTMTGGYARGVLVACALAGAVAGAPAGSSAQQVTTVVLQPAHTLDGLFQAPTP